MDRIEQLLSFITKSNSHYSQILNAQQKRGLLIEDYPLMTKEYLQNNRYNLLSDNYRGKKFDQLIRRTTSGSSGIPTNVYWAHKDYIKSLMSLWRLRKKYYGISPTSRQINFVYHRYELSDEVKNLEYYVKGNTLSFNQGSIRSSADYEKLYELMMSFNPDWLYIQPSMLNNLVDFLISQNKMSPNTLSYIESIGEFLPDEIKEKATNYFKVPVANMYGSEEMNGIALECPYHNMHIIEENVYVECLCKNALHSAGTGEIILTNLQNYAMPIVRYMQGDIVTIEDQYTCPCGITGKIIKTIGGRTQDSFELFGRSIYTCTLTEAISCVNNLLGDPIERYRFVYLKKRKKLLVYLKIAERFQQWKNCVIQEVEKALIHEGLINITFEFISQNEFPNTVQKQKILEVRDD